MKLGAIFRGPEVGSGHLKRIVTTNNHDCLRPSSQEVTSYDLAPGTIWKCQCGKRYELRLWKYKNFPTTLGWEETMKR